MKSRKLEKILSVFEQTKKKLTSFIEECVEEDKHLVNECEAMQRRREEIAIEQDKASSVLENLEKLTV